MKLQEMFFQATKRMEYFELGDWKFVNARILPILKSLSVEEQEEFDCDIKNINWA